MSDPVEIDAADWDVTVLASPVPVLVDFWAPWCGPCEQVAPVVAELADRYADALVVGKLDVDAHPGIAARYQVLSIPTLLLFKDGAPVERIVGARKAARIASTVGAHL